VNEDEEWVVEWASVLLLVEVKVTDSLVELLCAVLVVIEVEGSLTVIVALIEVLWLVVVFCVTVVVAVPISDVGYGVLELAAVPGEEEVELASLLVDTVRDDEEAVCVSEESCELVVGDGLVEADDSGALVTEVKVDDGEKYVSLEVDVVPDGAPVDTDV
jgi:hypothetical protein